MWSDLKFAWSNMMRRPGLAIAAVSTLALGMGVTTVMFSAFNGVLLRPLPYPAPDRIVSIWQVNNDWLDADDPGLRAFASRFPVAYPVFEDWHANIEAFSDIGAFRVDEVTEAGDGPPERIRMVSTTAGVFDVLRAEPALGRRLTQDADALGATPVAVLSDGYWRRRFGGDPGVLGDTVMLDGTPYAIVGVMPREFRFPEGQQDIWVNFDDSAKLGGRGTQFLQVVARLRDGMTIDSARAGLEREAQRAASAYPDTQGSMGARMIPYIDAVVGDAKQLFTILLVASALVLLVACVNVGNMLLVRSVERTQEMSIRAALGATKARLARLMFADSTLIVTAGGAVGILVAVLTLGPVLEFVPTSVPRLDDVRIDTHVLGFSLLVIAVTGLFAGTLPAFMGVPTKVNSAVKVTGPASVAGSRGPIRRVLVTVELSIALVMLFAAGLLGASLARIDSVPLGYDAEEVVSAELSGVGQDTDSFVDLYGRIREEVLAAGGVVSVSFAENGPFVGGSSSGTIYVDAGADQVMSANVAESYVSDGYFETLGTPMLQGRAFTTGDHGESQPVAIVSRRFAERFWGDGDAIGKRIRTADESGWRTVIGVVGDVQHGSLTQSPRPRFYAPLTQATELDDPALVMLVRTRGNPVAAMDAIRPAVWAAAPDVAVSNLTTLSAAVGRSIQVPRFRSLLIAAMAAMAAILAVTGVYALVAYDVSRRTAEFGLRMSLGATAGHLVREVAGYGIRIGLTGVLIGVPAAAAVGFAMRAMLFEIHPADARVLGVAITAMAAAIFIAAYVPARRAARIDPMQALREE